MCSVWAMVLSNHPDTALTCLTAMAPETGGVVVLVVVVVGGVVHVTAHLGFPLVPSQDNHLLLIFFGAQTSLLHFNFSDSSGQNVSGLGMQTCYLLPFLIPTMIINKA